MKQDHDLPDWKSGVSSSFLPGLDIRCQFIILARGEIREIRCQFIILARGEIRCQFIILARKDEPTPDFRDPTSMLDYGRRWSEVTAGTYRTSTANAGCPSSPRSFPSPRDL